MIIKKHKTIFIHIPKTAGTSVKMFFGQRHLTDQAHERIATMKKDYPEIYDSYRKFTIARNPYDRMVSWYFFLKLRGNTSAWVRDVNNSTLNFSDWLKNHATIFPQVEEPYGRGTFSPQFSWIYDFELKTIDPAVTIIKYENLNDELDEFFGEKINLPMMNKSDHDNYSTYYNRESLDIVNTLYEKDFEIFNYEKL